MSENNKSCSNTNCNKESCSGCQSNRESMLEELNAYSSIKTVVGVASGKGGVGKSFVTAMLAVLMSRKGYKVGILDADITGPSIPKMFGITNKAQGNEFGIIPESTKNNIKIMSINLLLPNDETPVVWRGGMLAGAVKQFWSDVYWGDLDFLFLDMPPGTGDVPLTVYQSIPLDGVVLVTSPQDLVSLIVKKANHMAKQMHIPVLGLVENFSYIKCPDCGKEISLFGESKLSELAKEMELPILGRLPIDSDIATLVNAGEFEQFEASYLAEAIEKLELNLAHN